MEGISASRIAEVKTPQINRDGKIQHTIINDMEPDSYIPSKKRVNAAEVAIAGGTAAGVYAGAKTAITKGLDWVSKEGGNAIKEWGEKTTEQALKIPGKARAIAIYGGAALTATGAFILALRDKDGDGQLDIIEGFRKMANPGS